MNEKLARKLGEVLAFARAGIDTYKKGDTALKEALGRDYNKFIESCKNLDIRISDIAKDNNSSEIVNKKTKKTFNKLNKMRDMYIGDDWDEAVEIFEWSGFFFGAGMVHWGLVESAAKEVGITELASLSKEGVSFYHKQLMKTVSELKVAGKNMV